jgi:hypothetical protein
MLKLSSMASLLLSARRLDCSTRMTPTVIRKSSPSCAKSYSSITSNNNSYKAGLPDQ